MESYGAILREKRESKDLSIEQVSREAAITVQYLNGLENEKDEIFPGEPYLVGFLKNYAEYLGLNSDDLIRLYHAKKIQEAPTPEALLKKQRPKFLIPLIVILSLFFVIALASYLYFGLFKVPQRLAEKKKVVQETVKIHQYVLTYEPQDLRLYKGDQLIIQSPDQGDTTLTINNTLEHLILQTPAGNQIFDLSDERVLDVNADGIPDISIYLSDISSSSEKYGAQLRVAIADPNAVAAEKTVVANDLTESADDTELVASNPAASTASNMKVIHEDNRSYPFTVEFSFRGPCYFRYRVDKNEKIERNFRTGETINVTPKNGLRLWMSNAYNVKLKVRAGNSAYDLEVGKAGQVAVEDIKWVRRRDGKYSIVVQEID